MNLRKFPGEANQFVQIDVADATLEGELKLPEKTTGAVIFAHGSGSSRHSPRNQFVARILREAGFGTLLFDLLTPAEEQAEQQTRHLRFDIPLLASRLTRACSWLAERSPVKIGLFGASTGAAAALVTAAQLKDSIGAVVSRGGRPDLAGPALSMVTVPTLLIVGSWDTQVIALNQEARAQMRCESELRLVEGATHLFAEPGTLAEAARLAAAWFQLHLQPQPLPESPRAER
jgi:putative phosphoribosyl transferase